MSKFIYIYHGVKTQKKTWILSKSRCISDLGPFERVCSPDSNGMYNSISPEKEFNTLCLMYFILYLTLCMFIYGYLDF